MWKPRVNLVYVKDYPIAWQVMRDFSALLNSFNVLIPATPIPTKMDST